MIHSTRLLFAMISLLALSESLHAEVRIKDITTMEGARGNHLIGVGLVAGLNGTGAPTQATQQMAIDMLRKFNITTTIARQSLLDNVYKSKSTSLVVVTADLSDVARKGSKLDVTVSVLDEATSLEGGILLRTPLYGADGEAYAEGQGAVSIGGFRTRGANNGQLNHPTVGRIQGGGYVEKEALGEIDQKGAVCLLLNEPDFKTSSNICQAINERFPGAAKTKDQGTVWVRIPTVFTRKVTEFVGEIGLLTVTPDTTAKVVINERTGTVVVGHNVRVSGVSISHRNFQINPNMTPSPRSMAGGSASAVAIPPLLPPPPKERNDRSDLLTVPLDPDERPQAFDRGDKSYTVSELARVLNALGATPQDLISIFGQLKASGYLHAEVVTNK
ncbi:MAG: flagellar basal body P-ring protein FlgI [Planctomycetia bacterium]|nr:flagellar basal body P-ring protein FlgI [Planctomycetia bacterium]